MPQPGAYRELFKLGLAQLLQADTLNPSQRADAEHYLQLLNNPEYKFGRMTYSGGKEHWGTELFFRS